MKLNLYRTLGLNPKATNTEIKKAYRKLAKENHPDKNPYNTAAAKKMLAINEAYEILSDKVKKKKYDDALMALLKREMENEKAKVRRSDFSNQQNFKAKNTPKKEPLNELLKEGTKNILVKVLKFVLKR